MANNLSINNMNAVTYRDDILFSINNMCGATDRNMSYNIDNMCGVTYQGNKVYSINNMCGVQ